MPLKKHYSQYLFLTIILLCVISFNFSSLKEQILLNKPPLSDYNKKMAECAYLIKNTTNPNTTVAVTWAGIIPYFAERKYYDFLGKCDKVIGHQNSCDSVIKFTPGHTKWNYAYTIGELKPDIIPFLWGEGRDKLWPILNPNYSHIMLSKDGMSQDVWIKNSLLGNK